MRWELVVDSQQAARRGAEILDNLGLSLPTAVEDKKLVFDSASTISAQSGRDIDEVICALWDTEAEVRKVRSILKGEVLAEA